MDHQAGCVAAGSQHTRWKACGPSPPLLVPRTELQLSEGLCLQPPCRPEVTKIEFLNSVQTCVCTHPYRCASEAGGCWVSPFPLSPNRGLPSPTWLITGACGRPRFRASLHVVSRGFLFVLTHCVLCFFFAPEYFHYATFQTL